MDREDAIQALMRTGKTREQCEAFLALLGSALARRGWAEGPVLSRDEIGEHFEKFVGDDDGVQTGEARPDGPCPGGY